MKKVILLIFLIVGAFQGFSQTPGINYQAVILDPNVQELPGANAEANILANNKIVVQFTIIDELNDIEYQEYHETSTDAYGMINLIIGHGTVISSNGFMDVAWEGLSKKLKVEIDFTGRGNNFTSLSEQDLTYIPQPVVGRYAQTIIDNTAAIITERNRASAAEAAIQADVNQNETDADTAIQANTDALSAEVTRATNAEGVNASTIAIEKTRAEAAEVTNSTAIATEKNRAETVEAGLQSAIGQNKVDADAAIQANTDALSAEVTRATNAEGNNITAIATEKSRAEAAEAANSLAIGTNAIGILNANTVIGNNTAAIATEKSRAEAAEAVNTLAIGTNATNISNANNAIGNNTTAIATEKSRAEAAEAANTLSIGTNATDISNANTVIGNNTAAIATEKSRAEAAEAANTLAIGTNATGVSTANSAIIVVQDDVDTNQTASELADANLGIAITAVQDDVDANETATQTALNLKVDKVTGKGLSSEDYSTAEKTKLAAITGTNSGDQDLSSYATNTNLALKANIASPTFTGIPIAPTATAATNTTQIATTAFVKSAVSTATTGNFVDLTTNQTIAGTKTFSSQIIAPGINSSGNIAVNGLKIGTPGGAQNTMIGIAPFTWASSVGNNNTVLGNFAFTSSSGNSNTAIGSNAIRQGAGGSGDNNTAVGESALSNGQAGNKNTAIGVQTLVGTTGSDNVAVGYVAGKIVTTGIQNTFIGSKADAQTGQAAITNSIAIGYNAKVAADNTIQLGNGSVTDVITSGKITTGAITLPNTDGTANQVLQTNGSGALTWYTPLSGATNVTGLSDALVESSSLYIGNDPSATTNNAQYNVAVGTTALDAITTGKTNVAVGYDALTSNTTGEHNTATGWSTLLNNTTASYNTAYGYATLNKNTTGTQNTANGPFALYYNTTGSNNTAYGMSAIYGNQTGSNNTANGSNALGFNTNGSYNTAIGDDAGRYLTNGSSQNQSGNYNVFLGSATKASGNTQNEIVIGYNATGGGSNTVQLGNTSITNVNTSGTITAGAVTYPNTDGAANQVLQTNGSGVLSWVTALNHEDGSNITNINADNISTGTLNNARLPSSISVSSIAADGSAITNLSANQISSGSFSNARISSSNVTQHQAALSISESQIGDLSHTVNTDDQTAQEVLVTPTGNLVATTVQAALVELQDEVSTAQTDADNNSTAIALKANIDAPTFTGIPAAPTATAGTNTTQLATTAFVTTANTSLQANIDNNKALADASIASLQSAATAANNSNFSTTIIIMINNGLTNFTNVNLSNVDFSGLDLTGIDMTGSTLIGITSGNVSGTPTLPTGYSLISGFIIGPGVKLTNADLTSQDLSNIDLTGADLTGADLANANLAGATLPREFANVKKIISTKSIGGHQTLKAIHFMVSPNGGTPFDAATTALATASTTDTGHQGSPSRQVINLLQNKSDVSSTYTYNGGATATIVLNTAYSIDVVNELIISGWAQYGGNYYGRIADTNFDFYTENNVLIYSYTTPSVFKDGDNKLVVHKIVGSGGTTDGSVWTPNISGHFSAANYNPGYYVNEQTLTPNGVFNISN